MSTPNRVAPFIIQPDPKLLELHPDLRRMSSELARLYATGHFVNDEGLKAVGQQLWQVLTVDVAFAQARQQAGTQTLPVVIASNDATIQQLPWETLYHPDYGFLGLANGFTLLRSDGSPTRSLPATEHGPLRVLLFTTLPDDLDAEKSRLDVEEEQAQVLEALNLYVAEGVVTLEIPDDGRFATLLDYLKKFRPHLLFLSGHGKFHHQPHSGEAPFASFLFEGDDGGSQSIDETQIANALLGSNVRCVVLSACESGVTASDALNNGLTWRLSQIGIPHVIGMRESVLDRAGTLFVRAFCDAVVRQESIDVALQEGRQAIITPLKDSPWLGGDGSGLAERSLGQWSLPLLISHDPAQPLIDWNFAPQARQRQLNQTLSTVSLPPRFIGRRAELRGLQSRLRRGQLRQLLITGPGGQGKTALAGKVAQLFAQRGDPVFAWSARTENDWQFFQLELELALTNDNAERYSRAAGRLPAEEARANLLLRLLLQQHNGRLVLFFDNLESCQNAATQRLQDQRIAAWIKAAQALTAHGLILLLTSRWKLPGWPDGDQLPLIHANYGDFLQMANRLLPLSFLRRRDWLRKVYATLHGNGRGLTFFAAAIQDMTPQQETTFQEKLAAAAIETQTDMALQQIVQVLPPPAAALLQRLPAYQTPVPLEGIIKLSLDLPDPPALLQRLLAVSLVEQVFAHDLQCDEYQLSPLLADWLSQQGVAPPDLAQLRLAAAYQTYLFTHQRHTLTQAIVTYAALQRAAEQNAADRLALDRIVGQLSLQGLYRTLLDDWLPVICQSTDAQTRGDALGQTGKQLLHIGQYDLALGYLERSLQIRQEIGDKAGEGTTLNNISQIFKARGEYETALGYLERSLQILQEIGDKAGEGATLNNISALYHARGDYETALGYLERSLQISQEIGDKAGEGTTLNNISALYHARSDYETALGYLERSLQILQEIGDKAGEGTTLNNISQIYAARGDYDLALGYLERSLQISQEIGDKAGEGTTLNNISQIYAARGDYDLALGYLERSLQILQEIGDKAGEGTTLGNIANNYHARGDYATALSTLERSLQIRQEIGDKAGEGTTLNNISQIYAARGDYDLALGYLERSLQIRQEISDKAGEGTTLTNIGNIYYARGEYETALGYMERSLQIRQEIGDKAGEGTTLNNIGQIYKARGEYATALGYLERSLQIRQEIGDKAGEGATLNNISQIYAARGDYDLALGYLERSLQISQEIGDKAGEGATLNNISALYHARGAYETALSYLERSLKILQEIGDMAGLCATLFNMGHLFRQNKQMQEAMGAWVTVYRLAKQMNLAQALQALEELAGLLGLAGGLAGWEALSQRMGE